jgi:hypothetical protein
MTQLILIRHAITKQQAATHATVLSMYLGHILKCDPIEIWKSLAMPAYVVLSLPEQKLVKIVNHIQDET